MSETERLTNKSASFFLKVQEVITHSHNKVEEYRQKFPNNTKEYLGLKKKRKSIVSGLNDSTARLSATPSLEPEESDYTLYEELLNFTKELEASLNPPES